MIISKSILSKLPFLIRSTFPKKGISSFRAFSQIISDDELEFGERDDENNEKGGSQVFEVKEGAKISEKKQKEFIRKYSGSKAAEEFMKNPEFLSAFPEIKERMFEELAQQEDKNFDTFDMDPLLFKSDMKTSKIEDKNKESHIEIDYFRSLQQKSYKQDIDKEDHIKYRENEQYFVEGFLTQKGPKKYLSKEQIDEIQAEIEIKMQELESTGLSRYEILFNKPGGLPLKNDPYFQYLKNTPIAREMLIKPNEEFCVETVLAKALQQDIGIDPSPATPKQYYYFKNRVDEDQEVRNFKRIKKASSVAYDPESYDYSTNFAMKKTQNLIDNYEKTPTFKHPPLTRGQIRKKFMRKINASDIEWWNTELLTKFINDSSQIKNRFQTRLRASAQHKLAKAVNHARNLKGLLPIFGNIRPSDKINLGSWDTEFAKYNRKVIDAYTGKLLYRNEYPDNAISEEDKTHLREQSFKTKNIVDEKKKKSKRFKPKQKYH